MFEKDPEMVAAFVTLRWVMIVTFLGLGLMWATLCRSSRVIVVARTRPFALAGKLGLSEAHRPPLD